MSNKIRSKQAIYTDAERKKALPENHPDAAYLVVGQGCEIHETELEKYAGHDKLVNSAPKPIETVTDHKYVDGEMVKGEKVKIESADTTVSEGGMAGGAKPNENPANDDMEIETNMASKAKKTAAKKTAAKKTAKK